MTHYIRRLSYPQAVEAINKMKNFGGDANISVQCIRVSGNMKQMEKFYEWLCGKNWPFDSGSKPGTEVNKEIAEKLKKDGIIQSLGSYTKANVF